MPASDDDYTPLDEVLELLRERAKAPDIETKDLCDVAKVFLSAEKAEADAIARLHGGRGGVTIPQGRFEREVSRLESEEPQPLFGDRDHDA